MRALQPLDVALYSKWISPNLKTAANQSARLNPVRT
jgi:hypothetical protein